MRPARNKRRIKTKGPLPVDAGQAGLSLFEQQTDKRAASEPAALIQRSVAAADRRAHALTQILLLLGRERRLDAARAGKALFPVRVVHVVDADRAARRRRVHELVVADIDA